MQKTKKSSNENFSESKLKQKNLERLFKQRQPQNEKSFLKNFEEDLESRFKEKELEQERGAIYSWKAKNFEEIRRHPRFYLIFYVALFALAVYALFTDNLLLAILVILFGLLFYLFEKNGPELHSFSITKEGIVAEDIIYPFSSLKSFWIFYEPGDLKELSLESERMIFSHINIPLGNADPIKIRRVLVNFLPEKEQEKTIVDHLERFF